MTKDVLIMVSGRQFDVAEEPIELITYGTYYLKNGKHYVLYEECPDDSGEIIKNRVKFHEGYFEMVKNGAVSSALRFVAEDKTSGLYQTSAGAVSMEVETHDILITETDETINVKVCYVLHINGQFISECEVDFKVQRRAGQDEKE